MVLYGCETCFLTLDEQRLKVFQNKCSGDIWTQTEFIDTRMTQTFEDPLAS
jgi:hypothetical protein